MNVRTTIGRVVLALSVAAAASSTAQTRDAVANQSGRWVELARLDPRARDVLTAWLATDCEAGDRGQSLSRVLSEGPKLQAALREAMTLGPPPERVEAARAIARAAYTQRQESLKRVGPRLFGPEKTTSLLAETLDVHEARATETLSTGWRERAMLVLGQIGDASALAELRRIAADPDNPNRAAATHALDARKATPPRR
jgi:hypothetical protein